MAALTTTPGQPTDPLFPHYRANYGLYTIFCAQNGPKDLTVHAFEPVPPVADICRANVAQYMPQGFTVCVCLRTRSGMQWLESIRIRPWLIYLVTTRLNNLTLPLNNPNLQNRSNTTSY